MSDNRYYRFPAQNESSFGQHTVSEAQIPDVFKVENSYSAEDMYNLIKNYMVNKYGQRILSNYRFCPEIDQLQTLLTKNNREHKRIASLISAHKNG